MENSAEDTILRNIRTDLRLSMNGMVAASMRAKGIEYRMNFGVDVPRLKQIAAKYQVDKCLVERMWREDVRELKILATMLCPSDYFCREDAERWVKDAANQEIREQVCKNLFQHLPYADRLVEDWIGGDDESIRTTGYWLFARLCIIRSELVRDIHYEELLKRGKTDLKSESLLLRQSALNALKFFGRNSVDNAERVIQLIANFEYSVNPQEREIFDLLHFEFSM